MAFKPHQSRCYCNKDMECCSNNNNLKHYTRSDASSCSMTSSAAARKLEKHDKFVKIKRNRRNYTPDHGLGHSQYSGGNFSRRNSATTTITTNTASMPSLSCGAMSYFEPPLKSILMSSTRRPQSSSQEYTEQRLHYECSKESITAAMQQQQQQQQYGSSVKTLNKRQAGCASNKVEQICGSGELDERLYALQQFRLENLNDCFNVHRQNDLKLQQHLGLISDVDGGKFKPQVSVKPLELKCCTASHKSAHATSLAPMMKSGERKQLTPAVVRQKLLQLRLQAEAIGEIKPSRKFRPIIDKSFALSYQETY